MIMKRPMLDATASSAPRPDTAGHTVAPTVEHEILLATDGSPAAFAATHAAAVLAARWAVTPRVLTVVAPTPIAFDPGLPSIPYDQGIEDSLRRDVGRQLAACDSALGWPHEITIGTPAAEIVRVCEEHASNLLVIGLRPHAFLDRLFRDETALGVMRHAAVPVLAVVPFLRGAPRHIAVAVDFSRASLAATRAAIELLDGHGRLSLVYVEPPPDPQSRDVEPYAAIYAQGVASAFGRLREQLATSTTVALDTVVLQGAVPAELLGFARRAAVDVIAVGSQRHAVARRAVLGSVTTALVRAASCSLLVMPPGRLT